jgi:Plasmid pRiA4b ORF-3-like protein
VLAAWGQGPEPTDADWDWLAVEAAAAALQDKGPDEALSRVWERMPGTDLGTCLAEVRATGHPDAAELSQAVAVFAASGAPRSIDQVAELKVSLSGSRPPMWRRVRLPATVTLGDLHDVIQVLFGWDGDHLHVFQAGKKQYSAPLMDLDETRNEEAIRLRDAMARNAGKISYTYDLGACWEHEITLEQTLPRFRSRACATPPPASPGPCTGATATSDFTSTIYSHRRTASTTCSTRSTATPPTSSGADPQAAASRRHPAPAQMGLTPPSQWAVWRHRHMRRWPG